MGFPGGSDGKVTAGNVGDPGWISGSGRPPGEGTGNPLQYSCLENSTDGGAWWATVHSVTKRQTQLSDFTFTFFLYPKYTKISYDSVKKKKNLIKKWCVCVHAKSSQSCLTLSVHGILQAGIPEWVAMPSFQGISQPRD